MIELTKVDYLFLEKENQVKGAEKMVLSIISLDLTQELREIIMDKLANFAKMKNEEFRYYSNNCKKDD